MSNSSAQTTNAFEHLRWSQILALLDVLREYELNEEQHVERRYRERAEDFAATLTFLCETRVIVRNGAKLNCGIDLANLPRLREHLLARVIEDNSPYREAMFRFLRRFRILNGEVVYYPDKSSRLRESSVRNFLMELDVIRYRSGEDLYVIDPSYISLYAYARQASQNHSPKRMASLAVARTAIGDAAEHAVLDWECKRLGSGHSHRVKHIAPYNSMAGYDILSATVAPNVDEPRYIEVKAVSQSTFEFYWSQGEVDVASVLGRLYYLYLVPIDGNGSPFVNGARMISNPYIAILSGKWFVETNVRKCRPFADARSSKV